MTHTANKLGALQSQKLPEEPRAYKLLIDGELIEGGGHRAWMERCSPAHGVLISRYPCADEQDVAMAVESKSVNPVIVKFPGAASP